jgi:hypothetical protein
MFLEWENDSKELKWNWKIKFKKELYKKCSSKH